jgi:hypothetical protein
MMKDGLYNLIMMVLALSVARTITRRNMDKLDEMMFWRDDMERYWYPLEMLREITESIDMIITEGMHNRK